MTKRPVDLSSLAFAGLAAALVLVSGPALAQDVERGRHLATSWCANCHEVVPGQGTSDLAPAFELIAKDPEKTERGLRAWLRAPHPPMPDFNLGEDEIDDLLGYIGSLRPE